MTNAQHDTDKMREEFKKWWIGSKYRQVIVADEFIESAAFDGWQASADKSSATIARLEERAAAAEADNAMLREAQVDELQAKVDALKWRPIETAPKDGERFLAKTRYGMYVAYMSKANRWASDGRLIDVPIGWMPLPAPDNQKG